MTTEFARYLGIAFASSALLIVLSKVILQFILRRPADYYLKEEYKQEERILNSAGFSINDEVETNPEGEVTEEHIHVEPQIPEPVPETHPVPEKTPDPAAVPMFEIPVSGTEPEPARPEPENLQPEKAETEKIPAGVPLTKSGKPRRPSMSMKKDELTAIAAWKGIALPSDATKAVILELIEKAE